MENRPAVAIAVGFGRFHHSFNKETPFGLIPLKRDAMVHGSNLQRPFSTKGRANRWNKTLDRRCPFPLQSQRYGPLQQRKKLEAHW